MPNPTTIGAMSVLPVFVSHMSLPSQGSLLTLEEPGKAKAGAPVSIFDLAKQAALKEVVLCDDRPDGLLAAYKVATKEKIKLCYGLKLVVCADGDAKDEASLGTESKVIVFARTGESNEQGVPKGVADLTRIWNRASTRGFYYVSRTDWRWLKEQWSEHLLLALPWSSSFIAKNTLTMNRIVPDLPMTPWVFREIKTELPFARLIDAAIDRYVKESPAPVQEVKSIYMARRADMEPYMVMRAKGNPGATFDAPGIDHLSSSAFSFEAFQSLCPTLSPSPTASP